VSHKPGSPSEQIKTLQGMAMNFLACDREQPFLMPPDPRDWLPEDHLAWFVGEFNWWTQRFAVEGIVDARRAPRRACASRASCVVCC